MAASLTEPSLSCSAVRNTSSGICCSRFPSASTAVSRTCQSASCNAAASLSSDTRRAAFPSTCTAAARTDSSSSSSTCTSSSIGTSALRFPSARTAAARTFQSSLFSFATRSSNESSDKACSGGSPRRCSTLGKREDGISVSLNVPLPLSSLWLMRHPLTLFSMPASHLTLLLCFPRLP